MGTWGTGIYSSDFAQDALGDIKAVFSKYEPDEGVKVLESILMRNICKSMKRGKDILTRKTNANFGMCLRILCGKKVYRQIA